MAIISLDHMVVTKLVLSLITLATASGPIVHTEPAEYFTRRSPESRIA